jgi:serine/threonine-protein kinase
MKQVSLDEAFARETAETTRSRLRVLAPLMAVLHILHVWHFWTPPALAATLSPDVLRWRTDLVLAHLAMLPFIVPVAYLANRSHNQRLFRWLGPAMALAYLLHGAFVAGVDQLVAANISVYIGYCFGVAVVTPLGLGEALFAYAAGGTTLVATMLALQRSTAALQENLPTAGSLTAVSIVLSWLLTRNRRRAFEQRTTIDEQREQLSALNASLEQRVEEQVAEIVKRAEEVDRLNAQLQAQVRERSGELSMALARLAQERSLKGDGSLQLGATLGGRFEVEHRIGRGGMGTVYAGVDRSTGARVAIKVIQASSIDQLDAMRRFIREVGAAATVSHPAVVRMLHLDVTADGLLFQVQELVDGEPLVEHVASPWRPADAARLVAVLCDALAVAHANGVVHRDVKPDNLMLTTAQPGIKLLDFGIAKLYDAVSSSGATEVRVVVGTPGYMAPEQAAGELEVTDRADVYAAGVLLHQLVTGKLPSAAAVAAPAPLATLIESCLHREASARPDAASLARQLHRFADQDGARPLVELASALPDGEAGAHVKTTPGKHPAN